jgi:ABC-type oligopeptide transport system ATPase subunit
MASLIEARRLVKRHYRSALAVGTPPAAVNDVSFSIERGEVFGLVGESGCGKSTLARALLHLDPPTSGEVRYDGTPLARLGRSGLRELRRKMQIVFQDPNGALDPRMRVRESMREGLRNLRVPARAREARIDELLDLVGISSDGASRYPHEFSGGQKQRIVIARSLSVSPEFLILDEPVSNLDVSIQAQIINLLLDLKERFSLTYLFISHDLHLVSYMSDRVGVMYRGRLVELAATADILARPLHPYTLRLFSAMPDVGGSAPCEEEPIDEGDYPVGPLRDAGGGHFVAGG